MTTGHKPTTISVGNWTIDLRQLIKLVIYSLLLINFAAYIADDWEIANHTRRNGGSFLDWTSAFAVSIDELAWFVLLFLFEMETYVLSDQALAGYRSRLIHAVRILCYLFLAHTLYAYGDTVNDLSKVVPIENTDALCQLVEADVSYASNLEYTLLDESNCADLSTGQEFYFIEDEIVVTDTAGLVIERQLAQIDFIEALVWLAILLTIEIAVRLQDRGITQGLTMRIVGAAKFVLYGLLWGAAGYWIYRGHWLFAWDEALWILGFVAIEMNMSEWKQEIDVANSG